jgi:hypothetical protein
MVALLLAVAAHAQTWNYSNIVTGTTQSLLSGTYGEVDGLPLASAAYTTTVSGSVVLTGATLTYNFAVSDPSLAGYYTLAGTCEGGICNSPGTVQSTGTGFNLSVNDSQNAYNGYLSALTITNGAATIQYVDQTGDCTAAQLSGINPSGYGTYIGGQVNNCFVSAASTTPATWVDPPASAPEIDPAGVWSALILLAGALAVLLAKPQRDLRRDEADGDAFMAQMDVIDQERMR